MSYFVVVDKGGAIKYSLKKERDSIIIVTIYFQNSLPEHIEYDLNLSIFRDYEGYKRPRTKFRENQKKRQEELKEDFLMLLDTFLENKKNLILQDSAIEVQEIISEIQEILKKLKNIE